MRKRSGIMAGAAALGRKGGLKGGAARARSLSPEERSASARHAARARWGAASGPATSTSEGPYTTREKIYHAAAAEFLQRGFDGARVDTIVKRAGVNKRMLYHYFGSKEGLYRELLLRNLTHLRQHEAATPATLGDSFAYWQDVMLRNPAWIRSSLLEALAASGPAIARDERQRFWSDAVDQIRGAQERGAIDPGLDAGHLQLALVALVMFPLLLPRFTEIITGASPLDPSFAARQLPFLRRLATLLEPAP
jgi:TetR/AcrR family transcriptional regulator